MPLPRLRLRTLMIAVAVVAIPLWLYERHWRFWKLAEAHRAAAFTQFYQPHAFLIDPKPNRKDWHRRLGVKYLRASARPWLPVPPDPPRPE